MKLALWVLALILMPFAFAQECSFEFEATETAAFMAEIPTINTNLAECPVALPSFVKTIYKNADFDVKPGDTAFSARVIGGTLSEISTDAIDADYIVTLSTEDFDAILGSDSQLDAFHSALDEGKITIEASSIWNTMRLWLAKLFI